MPTPVTVYKRKFDGHESRRFEGELVDDADGWLVVFSDASIHASFRRGGRAWTSPYFVYFLSTQQPYVVSFYFREDGALREAQCDVAMPATRNGNEIAYVDLELDLIILGDGSHYMRDFHEFADNRVAMAYPQDVVELARTGMMDVYRAFAAGQYPFDGTASRVLAQAFVARNG